ncbi:hypothetical protein AB0I68_31100 [Streptomyces sp. NPDC050448]
MGGVGDPFDNTLAENREGPLPTGLHPLRLLSGAVVRRTRR